MSNIFTELKRFREDRGLDSHSFNLRTYLRKDYEEGFELQGLPDTLCKEMAMARAGIETDFLENDQRIKDGKIRIFSNDFVKIDALGDRIVFAIEAIEQLGFDAEVVLSEIAREINSREGEVINGKFEKFKTKEAMGKWYKADFHKAKR